MFPIAVEEVSKIARLNIWSPQGMPADLCRLPRKKVMDRPEPCFPVLYPPRPKTKKRALANRSERNPLLMTIQFRPGTPTRNTAVTFWKIGAVDPVQEGSARLHR
jgi:hypothetical protein